MTGQLLWSEKEINNPYIRAVIKTNKGILMFRDIRTFGRINILPSLQELKNLTIHIGVDALKELTNTRLHNILKNAHTNIKSLLLNQQKISGLGNIYANEALFKSHIHPLKQASSITKSECNLLHQVIKETLENAIHHGGTSFSDFRGIHNEKGQYQHKNLVYQKENHPCSVCKTKIQRIIIQQRSSFYCPLCQKLDS
jgi:formamidopyrimidine-DNA glycosylase